MRTTPLSSSTSAPARLSRLRAACPMNSMPMVSISRSEASSMTSICPAGKTSIGATHRSIRLWSRLGLSARADPALRPRDGRWSRSMGKEHRQCGVDQYVVGGTAEDQLPEPAVGIGALDQEIGTFALAEVEHHLARRLAAGVRMARLRRDPGEQQRAPELG